MAFDPTLPLNNSPIVSAELRDQFDGLKDLIDALPTSGAMTDAIASQTAGKPDFIELLTQPISNPPTQAQVQAIQTRLNDLIDALNRA
jgi:hypothetical protein